MLRLIETLLPAPAHRAGLRVAHAVRLRWWRLRKPRLSGCRVIALDEAARVLLIRHSYGHDKWMLPGGGIAPGEDPVAAGTRELAEETGCTLVDARIVAAFETDHLGAPNHVHIVAGRAQGPARADGREITHAAFFAIDALPDHSVAGLAALLEQWLDEVR